MEYLIYPWEWLGNTLREMSLSGSAGNVAAICIYAVISLIPCILYVLLKKKNKDCKSDMFLPVISLMLFVMIYYLVNPTHFMTNAVGMNSIVLTGLFYSMLTGYVIFRVMEYSMSAKVKNLYKMIRIALYMVILVLVLAVVIEGVFKLPEAIQTLREANSSSDMWDEFFFEEPRLELTVAFLVFKSVVNVVPYLFEIVIIGLLIKLVRELEVDRYSRKVTEMFEKLSKLCMRMLIVTVILNVVLNVFQVIFRNRLHQIHMDVTIPILSIVFVLVLLLVSSYVRETQKMKEELDMFI